MEREFATAVIRVAKELLAALEQKENNAVVRGQHGVLANYSSDYVLGLGVSLGIMWESANRKDIGTAHKLELTDLLQWVRNLQQQEEARRSTLIQ